MVVVGHILTGGNRKVGGGGVFCVDPVCELQERIMYVSI